MVTPDLGTTLEGPKTPSLAARKAYHTAIIENVFKQRLLILEAELNAKLGPLQPGETKWGHEAEKGPAGRIQPDGTQTTMNFNAPYIVREIRGNSIFGTQLGVIAGETDTPNGPLLFIRGFVDNGRKSSITNFDAKPEDIFTVEYPPKGKLREAVSELEDPKSARNIELARQVDERLRALFRLPDKQT